MHHFHEIVDAADALPIEDQVALVKVLKQRIAQQGRARLVADVEAAEAEFEAGLAKISSPEEIMRAIRDES